MSNLAEKLVQVVSFPVREEQQFIEFGSWMPDQPDLFNKGSTEALNVIPTQNGFAPFSAFSADTDALTARPLGAAAVNAEDGNIAVYAGDATKLYTLLANVWTDASGATYTTASDGVWEFALFGATAIATNYDDPVQGITVGGATFADLITSSDKPKARHVDVVRDFVVLGNTNDTSDGVKPARVWWSGINDSTDFTPAAATQSDFQDVLDLGWNQKIVGGVEYGLAFFERGIERMTYVGSPEVFRFDRIDRFVGTPIPQSVIAHGRVVFFISEEGFMVNYGTGESKHIGHWMIDKEFWNQYDVAWNNRLSAAIDPLNKLVMWSFRGSNNTNDDPSEIYIFNWNDNRWSHVQVDHRLILRTLTQGLTLEQLDTITTDIDAFPYSLDSKQLMGGQFKLAGFDTSNQYGFFDGATLAATMDTREVNLTPGRFSHVGNAWPLVDGGTPTVASGTRVRQQDTTSFATAVSIETEGCSMLDSSSRYHIFRVAVPAASSWTHAQGVMVDYSARGKYG